MEFYNNARITKSVNPQGLEIMVLTEESGSPKRPAMSQIEELSRSYKRLQIATYAPPGESSYKR
jgi:hypothetical protein